MSHGFQSGLLSGRVAVVTGGAGAIGGETAVLLAELGAQVVAADIAADRLADLGRRIQSAGAARPTLVTADLCTPEGVQALAAAVRERHGGADILVNGLGEHLASAGAFEDGSEQLWQALYEVNLLQLFRVCREFVPGMKRRGWGRIVNFSSVEGVRAAPDLAVYAAFKRGVDGFTKSLAVELAPFGIVTSAVAVDKTRAHQTGHYALPQEYERFVPTWIPVGRYADPLEVARLTVFLASPLNTWVVGDTIAADGGTLSAGGWYRTPQRWTNQPLLTQYIEDPAVNPTRPPAVQ